MPGMGQAAACRDWCGNWVCGGVDVGSGASIRAGAGSGWGVRVCSGAQAVLHILGQPLTLFGTCLLTIKQGKKNESIKESIKIRISNSGTSW